MIAIAPALTALSWIMSRSRSRPRRPSRATARRDRRPPAHGGLGVDAARRSSAALRPPAPAAARAPPGAGRGDDSGRRCTPRRGPPGAAARGRKARRRDRRIAAWWRDGISSVGLEQRPAVARGRARSGTAPSRSAPARRRRSPRTRGPRDRAARPPHGSAPAARAEHRRDPAIAVAGQQVLLRALGPGRPDHGSSSRRPSRSSSMPRRPSRPRQWLRAML